MFKRSVNLSNTLGTTAGVLSLVLLVDHAIRVSWVEVLKRVLDYYVAVKAFVFSPLTPMLVSLVNYFSNLFGVNFELSPHWSDVFVLLLLYFGARARAYWDAGLRARSVFRNIYGVLISFLTGAISGVVPITSVTSSVLMVSIALFGIMAFELADCSWSATFSRKPGLAWAQDFKRYAAFSFPPLYINAALLLVGALIAHYVFPTNGQNVGLVLLLIFALVLACYWLIRGWLSAGEADSPLVGKSRWQKFQKSSNTRIGVLMLVSIFGALIFILLNAGLGYAGL